MIIIYYEAHNIAPLPIVLFVGIYFFISINAAEYLEQCKYAQKYRQSHLSLILSSPHTQSADDQDCHALQAFEINNEVDYHYGLS